VDQIQRLACQYHREIAEISLADIHVANVGMSVSNGLVVAPLVIADNLAERLDKTVPVTFAA
jgi:hypothetical protein